MTVVVTGGAGFIGSALVRALVGGRNQVVTVDKLTYAGNIDNLASSRATRARIRARRHLRSHRDGGDVRASTGPDAVIISPPRAMSTARSTAARLRCDQHRRHATLLRRARVLAPLDEPAAAQFRFCRYPPTRSSAARRRRLVRRETAATAQFALFGDQGRRRPPRAGLASHLRAAGGDLQLLQQLRSLSVSREAGTVDGANGARGQAAAGLRDGRQCARLAVR